MKRRTSAPRAARSPSDCQRANNSFVSSATLGVAFNVAVAEPAGIVAPFHCRSVVRSRSTPSLPRSPAVQTSNGQQDDNLRASAGVYISEEDTFEFQSLRR